MAPLPPLPQEVPLPVEHQAWPPRELLQRQLHQSWRAAMERWRLLLEEQSRPEKAQLLLLQLERQWPEKEQQLL